MLTFGYEPLSRKGVFLVGHAAENEGGQRVGRMGKGGDEEV